MAIVKGRLRPEGSNNYGDVVYLETSGEQVKLNNGQTAEQLSTLMADLEQEVETHNADIANPHKVTKANVGLGSVLNYGIATKTEAEAGTSNAKYMTPLRVKEAIDKISSKWNLIQTITVSTNTPQVDISIPSQYKQIKIVGRNIQCDLIDVQKELFIRFNNNTSGTYNVVFIYSNTSTVINSAGADKIVLNSFLADSPGARLEMEINNEYATEVKLIKFIASRVGTMAYTFYGVCGFKDTSSKINTVNILSGFNGLKIKSGTIFEVYGR